MRQIATTTSETNALDPINQNGRVLVSPRLSTSTLLTTPVSRWSMKFQVITPA